MVSILKRCVPYIPAPTHSVITIKRPYITYLLSSSLIFFFFVEVMLSETNVLSSLTPTSLFAFGGQTKMSVLEGQWFRLICASLLHANIFHLLMNLLALFAIGAFLEKILGHAWFFVVYFISALGGGLLSIFINHENIVSVGASSAIMGITAASLILVMSNRLSLDIDKKKIIPELLQWLIPSLLPLVNRSNVDFAGHIGGAITGALVALFLVKIWNIKFPLPRYINFARTTSLIALVLMFSAIYQADKNWTLWSSLIDEEIINEIASASETTSANDIPEATIKRIQREYPNDPRTWYFSALQHSDLEMMERYIRRALSKKEALHSIYFKSFELEKECQIVLVHILLDQGKEEEAQEILHPHCSSLLHNDQNKRYSFKIYSLCRRDENANFK